MTYSNWDDGHIRRVKAIVLSASMIITLLGLCWCVAFFLADRPVLAALHLSMAGSGASMLWLIHRGRLRTAAIVQAHLLPLFIGIFCLFDEVPLGLPRAAHLHFLPVAIGCYFVFRKQCVYLKFVIPLLCLGAFLVFGNTSLVIHDPALVIPPKAAGIAVWINTLTSLFAIILIVMIMNADLTVRRMMDVEMRKAIANGDFRLHYQPQFDEDRRLIGAEALIRWPHAKMGNIPPVRFIPLAEETGLIVPIGNWVLRAACAQLAAWESRQETQHLTLSVNVSASQFRQPDFVQHVSEIVRLSGIRPSKLKLELTESMFVENIDETVDKMNALRSIGIIWSLDDFGTGYSALSVLPRFPLGQVKIDQAFVRDMLTNESNMLIIETIVGLARNLKLQIVAEGVETPGHFERLREAGCDIFQGFFFSPPVEIATFESRFAPKSRAQPFADDYAAARQA